VATVASSQERLRVEREERERRRAEAEEKRKEMRKKLSQSDEHDHASPLSQKMTSPLVSKACFSTCCLPSSVLIATVRTCLVIALSADSRRNKSQVFEKLQGRAW